MVKGHPKAAFKAWLAPRPKAWRDGVKVVVAMDGFTGFKTAANEKLPTATTVMDPFHIARLAKDAPDQYRHRAQQELHRHHGRADDPLFRARRTLHTSNDPTETINGHLEHLQGPTPGFRNLTHYITQALLETGGFRPALHPRL